MKRWHLASVWPEYISLATRVIVSHSDGSGEGWGTLKRAENVLILNVTSKGPAGWDLNVTTHVKPTISTTTNSHFEMYYFVVCQQTIYCEHHGSYGEARRLPMLAFSSLRPLALGTASGKSADIPAVPVCSFASCNMDTFLANTPYRICVGQLIRPLFICIRVLIKVNIHRTVKISSGPSKRESQEFVVTDSNRVS